MAGHEPWNSRPVNDNSRPTADQSSQNNSRNMHGDAPPGFTRYNANMPPPAAPVADRDRGTVNAAQGQHNDNRGQRKVSGGQDHWDASVTAKLNPRSSCGGHGRRYSYNFAQPQQYEPASTAHGGFDRANEFNPAPKAPVGYGTGRRGQGKPASQVPNLTPSVAQGGHTNGYAPATSQPAIALGNTPSFHVQPKIQATAPDPTHDQYLNDLTTWRKYTPEERAVLGRLTQSQCEISVVDKSLKIAYWLKDLPTQQLGSNHMFLRNPVGGYERFEEANSQAVERGEKAIPATRQLVAFGEHFGGGARPPPPETLFYL